MIDDVYGHEKELEAEQPYAQRTTELGVTDAGFALSVNTLVIISPAIYGRGIGICNKSSAQTFFLCAVLAMKKSAGIGEGASIWVTSTSQI